MTAVYVHYFGKLSFYARLSVCLSAWHYMTPARRIFIQFGIYVYLKNMPRKFIRGLEL